MILEPATLRSYVNELQHALQQGEIGQAAEISSRLSASRVAAILQEAPYQHIIPCLKAMPPERAGKVIGHLPPEMACHLMEDTDQDSAVSLLSLVQPDRAADIIVLLPENLRNKVLDHLEPESKGIVNELMYYPAGTSGAVMSTYFLAISTGATIGETLEAVTDAPAGVEHKSYIYVLGAENKPVGVVSLKQLLRLNPADLVDTVMDTDIVAVHTSDPAVDAARIMRQRRFRQLPVLNDDQIISGIIVLEDALDILSREVADQFVKIGAASVEESFYSTPSESVKKRLPWMAGNIFLNLGAVAVISFFEDTIAAVAVLAVFLPMITDMGGNVGIQALSVSIRSIALGEARLRDFWKACRKEVFIGLVNGVALGLLFAALAWFLRGDPILGAIAGLALGINVFLAGIVGGTLPFIIKKMGKDPAMMTGPVLTTITDITGVTIYLGLATLFLSDLLM